MMVIVNTEHCAVQWKNTTTEHGSRECPEPSKNKGQHKQERVFMREELREV